MLTVVDRLTALNRQVTLNLSAFCLVLSMLVVSADAIGRKLGITVPGAVSITELFIAGMVFGEFKHMLAIIGQRQLLHGKILSRDGDCCFARSGRKPSHDGAVFPGDHRSP